MKFDLNRSMENEKTRKFTMIIIVTLILLCGTTLTVVTFTGGRIKTPLLEIDRSDAHNKDTAVILKKEKSEEKKHSME